MSFSNLIASLAYSRSGDVSDPRNANKDWRAGYAVGRYEDTESMEAITQEWVDRGEPSCADGSPFSEWKVGFWAGRFARIDDRLATSKQSTDSNEPKTGGKE